MHTHVNQDQESKSQSVANTAIQKPNDATFQFVDNRSEAIAQREFSEVANNSAQTKQLKVFQHIANQHESTQAVQRKTILDGATRGRDDTGAGYPTIKTSVNFDTNHLVVGDASQAVTRLRGTTRNIARNTVVQESQLETTILANEDAIVASKGDDSVTQLDFPDGSAKQWIKEGDHVYPSPKVGIKARDADGDTEIHHIHESSIDIEIDDEEAWPSL